MQRFGTAIFAALLASASPLLAQGPAPVADLVRAVDIPYEQFTLPNGLRVITHTDRKAPVVAVSVWYHIGSKNEPAGKTGFAHLFEHLMFNGSENFDDEWFSAMETIGATDLNGTTNADRTNYFQNVPTPALDRVLFLESDRMGHLLGAVTKAKLDNQRGVVQNEKRQGDNQPYGLTRYALLEGLYPDGHPYRHSTIGSMADLDAASLTDVGNWFRSNYGPNNAVVVLAGDIDAKTARPLVEKYFGSIQRGPAVRQPATPLPPRPGTTRETMHDKVANARLTRAWLAPSRTDLEAVQLDVAATILAGGQSSRLYNHLVRDKQLAVSVNGYVQPGELASVVTVSANVKPGVDPAAVDAAIDAVMATYLKDGPTADEVARVATRAVSGTIRGLEEVGGFGGKATALAEGALYAKDPGFYKRELAAYAAATPATVAAASRKWLSKGDFRLSVLSGAREADDVALAAADGEADAAPKAVPAPTPAPARGAGIADRGPLPGVDGFPDLDFPGVERTTLSNGLPVVFARRATVPVVEMSLAFDAGVAADSRAKPGLQALMLGVLDEGTRTRSATEIVEQSERLGASIGAGAAVDRTRVGLSALVPNLAASLDLFADVVRNPAFAPAEVERVRAIQLSGIAQEQTSPGGLAVRALMPALYGEKHPYGVPFTGTGTVEGVKAVTRADLVDFHARWIRPDNATLFVVGDTSLNQLKPLLERALGDWRAPSTPKGAKTFTPVEAPAKGRVILIDRPGPQSLIFGGMPLQVKGTDDPLALDMANEILGGSFTSRLNTDLRETKGWAYGAGSGLLTAREQMPFTVQAPVQADRTADSLKAVIDNITAFQGQQPPTPVELTRAVNNNVRSLPGSFESSDAVLGTLERNATLGRPDDYAETLGGRYTALTQAQLLQAVKAELDPARFTWIVVGDAKQVEAPLRALGLPVEVRQPN